MEYNQNHNQIENTYIKYSCQSCGAEILSNSVGDSLTCCPYCSGNHIIINRFNGEFKPDYIIPFSFDKDEAKSRIQKYYKNKKFIPDEFRSIEHLDDIKGIFIPAWLFNQKTEGIIHAKCEKNSSFSNDNKQYSEKCYYQVKENGVSELKNQLVVSSSRLPDGSVEGIKPFDFGGVKPFSEELVNGFFVGKYDITKGEARKQIDTRSKKILEDHILDTLGEYDSIGSVSKNIKIKETKTSYALLPVWFMNTVWNGENYIIAVNGQTGKVFGEIPVDEKKYKKWFLIIAAVTGVAISVICSFIFL